MPCATSYTYLYHIFVIVGRYIGRKDERSSASIGILYLVEPWSNFRRSFCRNVMNVCRKSTRFFKTLCGRPCDWVVRFFKRLGEDCIGFRRRKCTFVPSKAATHDYSILSKLAYLFLFQPGFLPYTIHCVHEKALWRWIMACRWLLLLSLVFVVVVFAYQQSGVGRGAVWMTR